VLVTSGVCLYLVEILLLSSHGPGLLHVKGGTDLDKGFLGYLCLLLTHGECFLPPHKLPLQRKELLSRCSC
jgi:hypothetical protein